ncbi:hypothetical protein AHF37_02362 [Paragonimus kellicotti]|nr:hypothetical protein AHF37_02362 [Paragonimus kellicotti]
MLLVRHLILTPRNPNGLSWRSSFRALYTTGAFEFLSKELFHPDYVHMKFLTGFLDSTHTWLHLPWDLTIVSAAVILRSIVTFPFYVYAEKNHAKVFHIFIDCKKSTPLLIQKVEQSAFYRQLDDAAAKLYLKRMSRRVFLTTCQKNDCHPLKSSAAAIVQIPLWFSFTYSLRNLCGFQTSSGYKLPPFCSDIISEGLNVACCNVFLPFSLLIAGLANVELMYLRQPRAAVDPEVSKANIPDPWPYRLSRALGWLGNGSMFFFSFFVPKAFVLYWLTSTVHQLCTHLLVMHPAVRRFFNIWLRPNEGSYPFKVLLQTAQSRYAILRWLQSNGFIGR